MSRPRLHQHTPHTPKCKHRRHKLLTELQHHNKLLSVLSIFFFFYSFTIHWNYIYFFCKILTIHWEFRWRAGLVFLTLVVGKRGRGKKKKRRGFVTFIFIYCIQLDLNSISKRFSYLFNSLSFCFVLLLGVIMGR